MVNLGTLLWGFGIIAITLQVACGDVTPTRSQSSNPIARDVQTHQWYEGGTLHNKSALDWQVATASDKLATCADFVAAMWQNGSLIPRIQDSVKSVDDMRLYSQELVAFLDSATEELADPTQNRQMYANQKVASLASEGMVSMGWIR